MTQNGKTPQARIRASEDVYKLNEKFKMVMLDIETEKHAGGIQHLKRVVFERGDAVGVIAYDPVADKVLLVNEMRPGMLARGDSAFSDCLAAGMIDKGETPVAAAVREMKEETGLVLSDPELVHGGAYVSPGGTSERIALVYGRVDITQSGGIHGQAAEGEDIKSVVMNAEDFIRRAKDGTLTDMKTAMGGWWLADNRARLRKAAHKAQAPQKKKKMMRFISHFWFRR